jgi:hypothetical protein
MRIETDPFGNFLGQGYEEAAAAPVLLPDKVTF